MTRLCACGREVTNPHRNAKKCDLCKGADPHRHSARKNRVKEMAVSIDLEGSHDKDGIMRIRSASFGREDGTSDSLSAPPGKHMTGQTACRWLIEQCSGPYKDAAGVEHKQVAVAFHFGWDSATMAKDFAVARRVSILHNAKPRSKDKEYTPLCNTIHTDDDLPCTGKIHRYNRDSAIAVMNDGESDLLVFDEDALVGVIFTSRRRFHAEYRPNGDHFGKRLMLDIHDTGSAFTGGLLKVIEKWAPVLTPEQHAAIEWGKKARHDNFLDGSTRQIEQYSEAECVAHARCVRLLVDAFRTALRIPFKVSQLYGSGSVAAAAFKHHKVTRREHSHVEEKPFERLAVDDLARLTYFGGLIEAPVLGIVAGLVDEVDINSAYPSHAIHLPCMRSGHGHWHRHRGTLRPEHIPDWATVGHVRASWSVDTPSTPPFLVRRKDGRVCGPLIGGQTWVSLAEYRAAIEEFKGQVFSSAAIWWVQECSCDNPLAWLAEAYAFRGELKAQMENEEEGSPAWQALNCRQEVVKLLINSCYGKLAQQRPDLGSYTNLHYASYITGATRAQVRRMTWQREREGGIVVYQHTDSVLSMGGDPRDEGPDLGKWKLEKRSENLLIVQPGLAHSLGGGKTASRGANKKDFVPAVEYWAGINDFTKHPTEWQPMVIDREMMMSWSMAVHRGHIEKAGSFNPQPLTVNFGSDKRSIREAVQMACGTAWQVPPTDYVEAVATVEDLETYETSIQAILKHGEKSNVSMGL